MSRVGKKPVVVPSTVQVTFDDKLLKAKGPKGELELNLPKEIDYNLENNILTFSRQNEDKYIRSIHGLTRSLAANVIEGVSTGFSKTLQIEGVGYKVEMKGTNLMLSLGFSHPILFIPPPDVQIMSPTPNTIVVSSISKHAVGEVAARLRKLRPPEPYKGKGIRYAGEYVRRKAGKTTAK